MNFRLPCYFVILKIKFVLQRKLEDNVDQREYKTLAIEPIMRLVRLCNSSSSYFKQFIETNCSKERPGSIVTEILKNGIFITIVTSKELNFDATLNT